MTREYVEDDERALLREARELGREAWDDNMTCPYGSDPYRRLWHRGLSPSAPVKDAHIVAETGWTCVACAKPGHPPRWEMDDQAWDVCPHCGYKERIK
jgi:hypothetical protein